MHGAKGAVMLVTWERPLLQSFVIILEAARAFPCSNSPASSCSVQGLLAVNDFKGLFNIGGGLLKERQRTNKMVMKVLPTDDKGTI